MNKRTKFLLGIGVIAALVIGWQVAAFAVHQTGAFELDGNASSSTTSNTPPDDWDRVCHEVLGTDCSTTFNTHGSAARSFVSEPNLNSTIFTGGGSKDPNDVSSWKWKDGAGGLPDKDNLLDSFAARYNGTSDGDVLFFGSDRYDNSGDAQQGFWFFQNKVTQNANGTFNGVHKLGDLLVISDFSNGGSVSTITVYKWNPAVSGNLELLSTSANANCASPNPDSACGIVNPASGPGITNGITPSPWSFSDKSGNTGFANGEFFEGGISLTDFGLQNECFSSVASETRSSTSTTAVLKDFVLGQLQQCQAGLTTQASNSTGTVLPGTSITDTATVSVSGGTNAPDPTGNVTFFLCGPSATGACTTGGTQVGGAGTTVPLVGGTANDGTATATSAAVAPTAAGTYCFRATWPGDTNYPGALSHTNTSTTGTGHECFTVQQTSSMTTAQKWLPNDTATVTLGSGGPATGGSVTFELFKTNGTCTGTADTTFTDNTVATGGVFETDNTTYQVTATGNTVISWKATYNPPAGVTAPSSPTCETSTLTITN